MVRTARLAVIAAFLVATWVAFGSDASAVHSWGKYHWARSTNPLALQLGDNVENNIYASWETYLAQTSSDWSESAVLNTTVSTGSSPACAPVSGTVQVCNANYGANGWLGLAQIWITRGSHIAQGVAKMNDHYPMNAAQAKHVMCQEVGHTFGLGHTSEDGTSQNTCMDYYKNLNGDDAKSTTPNAHDYEQLAKIYKHVDRFNTAASGSSDAAVWVGGHAPDGTPRAATPALGRWYAQDLGNGRLLLTHVNWK